MAVPVLAWIGERIASVEAAAAFGSVVGDDDAGEVGS